MPIINIVSFVWLIVTNVLGTSGSFMSKHGASSVPDISDKYLNRMTPESYAFSIWGLIYLGLAAWLIAHTVQGLIRGKDNSLFNSRIGFLFPITCLFNGIWVFVWTFEKMWVSAVITTLGLLIPLILIYYRAGIHYGRKGQNQLLPREFTWEDTVAITDYPVDFRPIQKWEFWTVYPVFSLYLGWICVATFINWICAFQTLNKPDSGVRPEDYSKWMSPQFWSILFQCVSTALTLVFFMLFRRDFIQPLVQMWALLAIAVKQRHIHGGRSVEITSWINLLVTAASWITLVFCLSVDYYRRRLSPAAKREYRHEIERTSATAYA